MQQVSLVAVIHKDIISKVWNIYEYSQFAYKLFKFQFHKLATW